MTRIFTTLALFSVALLCANIVLGLAIGDYNGVYSERKQSGEEIQEQRRDLERQRRVLRDRRPRPQEKVDEIESEIEELNSRARGIEIVHAPMTQRKRVHFLLGVVAVLTAVLVNSICVTYFIGTSRWIREVVDTYGFPQAWIAEANHIKRRAFPWALASMLAAVGIAALGQAADPETIRAGTASWVTPHMIGAMLGTAFIAYAFFVQHQRIYANYEIIQRIVAKVKEVRRAKGLDVEEQASMPTLTIGH